MSTFVQDDLAQIEQLLAERDDLRAKLAAVEASNVTMHTHWDAALAKLAAAELHLEASSNPRVLARHAEVIAERDAAVARAEDLEVYREANERNAIRLEETQARVAQLRNALEKLLKRMTQTYPDAPMRWPETVAARAVLEETKP